MQVTSNIFLDTQVGILILEPYVSFCFYKPVPSAAATLGSLVRAVALYFSTHFGDQLMVFTLAVSLEWPFYQDYGSPY